MGEVLLGNLANFIFWENLTVILVWKCSINYASRNRVKTLTLNTDLTTFCKLTAFFLIFILFYFFMVPLLLLSLVQMSLKQWGSFWELGQRSGQGGWVLSSSALPDLSICARKGTENPFLCSHPPAKTLQQIRTGWDQVAEENGMRGNCAQRLCSAGKNWLLPCSVWSEPCSQGMMCCCFLWSKVRSEFIGCSCRWFQWILLGGKAEISQLLLVWHSSAVARGLLLLLRSWGQHWHCVSFKHKEIKDWRAWK